MKNIFYKLIFGIFFLSPFISWGNVQLANLKQDLELISRELTGLRSEVELLRRENAQLRVVVDSFSKKANSDQGISAAQVLQINSRLSSLEKEYRPTQNHKQRYKAGLTNRCRNLSSK